jgi:predicted nucleic acid-binding protein
VKKASIRSRCPVTVIEVFKNVLRQRGEPAALIVTTLMKQGKVIALDSELAMDAAKLGVRHKLPLADSIIFATAQKHAVVLLTPDSDFLGLENVRCISRKSTKT